MASQIVVNEFDVCHKFVNDLECNCRHIDSAITRRVSCEDFVIFIDYNDSSAKLIEEKLAYIKKKAYVDRLDQYCWKIQRPLVEKNKSPSYSNYKNIVQIIFTANYKERCHVLEPFVKGIWKILGD